MLFYVHKIPYCVFIVINGIVYAVKCIADVQPVK